MAVNPQKSGADAHRAFELKAANFTLPILRLFDNNVEAVAARLGAKVEKAPDFFRNTPVVIDLSMLPEGAGAVEFPLLVGLLRGYGMIPFGVRGGSKDHHSAAEALELAVLRDSYVRRGKSSDGSKGSSADSGGSTDDVPAAPAAQAQQQSLSPRSNLGFMLVKRPVRSGQRVYASGGDLTITAAVSSGAELMADGNIHVYGPLRGRALAGMNGNLEARIFCQDLQAELVSIAGHYRVSEHIPIELRGVPVQIFLDQKILRIEKL